MEKSNSEIVAAIKTRKQQFVETFMARDARNHFDQAYFTHICIVLNHAEKIFSTDVADMCTVESINHYKHHYE